MKAIAIPITAKIGIRIVSKVSTEGSIKSDSAELVPLTVIIVSPAPEINPKPKGKIKAITIRLTAIIITFFTDTPIIIHQKNF